MQWFNQLEFAGGERGRHRTNTLILKNAMIIDGTGSVPLANGFVIVEGERIKEILPGLPGSVPFDATVIDCRQQTLLPGLIDAAP